MNTEPVVTVASITAGVTALLTLLTAFGVFNLTAEQQFAVMGVVAVLAPLATILARKWAYSPATVAQIKRDVIQ